MIFIFKKLTAFGIGLLLEFRLVLWRSGAFLLCFALSGSVGSSCVTGDGAPGACK